MESTVYIQPKGYLPLSIETRAIDFILSGIDPVEAVKLAFEAEEQFICSLLKSNDLSKMGHFVAGQLSNTIWKKINSQKPQTLLVSHRRTGRTQ